MKTLNDHLTKCPFNIEPCSYSSHGCRDKIYKRDMEKHLEEMYDKHLILIADVVKVQQNEINELKQKIRNNKSCRPMKSLCLLYYIAFELMVFISLLFDVFRRFRIMLLVPLVLFFGFNLHLLAVIIVLGLIFKVLCCFRSPVFFVIALLGVFGILLK
eukprot:TRINITY_DN2579_c0_g1_i2.p1 TRINITY_DN2579_c0_g1~~TRINITY_DN2579_c0_g1_i2.p1  ORF type:complete len:158 (+),score=4.98 TRINITY_DN2579_c0_g1_i2:166-639(+)